MTQQMGFWGVGSQDENVLKEPLKVISLAAGTWDSSLLIVVGIL